MPGIYATMQYIIYVIYFTSLIYGGVHALKMEGSGLCDAYTAVFPSYILPSLLRAGMAVFMMID